MLIKWLKTTKRQYSCFFLHVLNQLNCFTIFSINVFAFECQGKLVVNFDSYGKYCKISKTCCQTNKADPKAVWSGSSGFAILAKSSLGKSWLIFTILGQWPIPLELGILARKYQKLGIFLVLLAILSNHKIHHIAVVLTYNHHCMMYYMRLCNVEYYSTVLSQLLLW